MQLKSNKQKMQDKMSHQMKKQNKKKAVYDIRNEIETKLHFFLFQIMEKNTNIS